MSALTQSEAERLLFEEAKLLDERRFKEWLALYVEDALYWMPAWRDDGTQTQNPERELSLIYYRGRRNLEDRVWRLNSRQSIASQIAVRTVHSITNIQIDGSDGETTYVRSCFVVHRFDPRTDQTDVFFGHYEHGLKRLEGNTLIASKMIKLQNDRIPTVLDINSI